MDLTNFKGFDFSNPVVKEEDGLGYKAIDIAAFTVIYAALDLDHKKADIVINNQGFTNCLAKAFRELPPFVGLPVVEFEPKAILFSLLLISSNSIGKFLTLRRDCVRRGLTKVTFENLIEMYPYGFYTNKALIERYQEMLEPLNTVICTGCDTDTARMLRIAENEMKGVQ